MVNHQLHEFFAIGAILGPSLSFAASLAGSENLDVECEL